MERIALGCICDALSVLACTSTRVRTVPFNMCSLNDGGGGGGAMLCWRIAHTKHQALTRIINAMHVFAIDTYRNAGTAHSAVYL